MKKLTLFIGMLLIMSGIYAQASNMAAQRQDAATPPVSRIKAAEVQANGEQNDVPQIRFGKMIHEFGEIVEGDVVTYRFEFTNVGEVPVTIEKAQPSCGCTTTAKSEGPVNPGEKGFVEAKFNSAHKRGFQQKALTVFYGAEQPIILYFKGEVVAAADPADAAQ